MPPHTCHSIRAQWRSFYFNNKKKEEENEKKAGRKVAKKKRREKERKKKKPSGGVLRYRAHYATQYGRQFRFAIKSDSLSSFYFASFRGHDGGVSVVLLFSISSADSHSHTHSGRSTSGRCRTFLRNWIFFLCPFFPDFFFFPWSHRSPNRPSSLRFSVPPTRLRSLIRLIVRDRTLSTCW